MAKLSLQSILSSLVATACLAGLAAPVNAFQENGCGSGKCTDCHHLDKHEAAELLSVKDDSIVNLSQAAMPGLWEVDVRSQGKVFPAYIDFSKQYLISGSIFKIKNKEDITRERFADLNPVDLSQIPLDDALVVGDAAAKTKVIVFSDPQCPFCSKEHAVIKQLVAEHPEIAFYIKLYPLSSHPDSYNRATAIVCAHSLAMLEDSYAGKNLERPTCKTDKIDNNLQLAEKIGVHSTPTLILPDGRVMPGFKTAEQILALLNGQPDKEAHAEDKEAHAENPAKETE